MGQGKRLRRQPALAVYTHLAALTGRRTRMRGFIWLMCLAMFATIAPAQQKKRVAVFDFEYGTVQSSSAAIFGTNVDVGKGIADLMVNNLVSSAVYSVVERKALDKVM